MHLRIVIIAAAAFCTGIMLESTMHLMSPAQAQEEPNPYMKLDHLAIVVKDLDTAVDHFRKIGFDVMGPWENNPQAMRWYR